MFKRQLMKDSAMRFSTRMKTERAICRDGGRERGNRRRV
jgi:hypothetical protein